MKFYLAAALVVGWILQSSIHVSHAQTYGPIQNSRVVPWSQVPGAVQESFKAYSGKDVVVGVRTGVINGQVVYRAALDRDGQTVEVLTTEDGSPYSPMNEVAWNEVPSVVQETYSSVNNRQALEEITTQEQPGYTVYNFNVNNYGQRSRLEVAQDGGIVGYKETGEAGTYSQASPAPGSVITESAGAARNAGTERRRGVVRIEQIPFENLSQAAQETVTSVAGGAAIQSIEPEVVNGILCYEVKYDMGGQMAAVCVSNDGLVIK